MTSVIDASVAAKWILPDEGSDAAEDLLLYEGDCVAPEFLMIEIGNILRSKLMRQQIEERQVRSGFEFVRTSIHRFVPDSNLVQRAMEIALDCSHSVYDCMYLACAERERAQVLTADLRFLNKVGATSYSHLLRPLGV